MLSFLEQAGSSSTRKMLSGSVRYRSGVVKGIRRIPRAPKKVSKLALRTAMRAKRRGISVSPSIFERFRTSRSRVGVMQEEKQASSGVGRMLVGFSGYPPWSRACTGSSRDVDGLRSLRKRRQRSEPVLLGDRLGEDSSSGGSGAFLTPSGRVSQADRQTGQRTVQGPDIWSGKSGEERRKGRSPEGGILHPEEAGIREGAALDRAICSGSGHPCPPDNRSF